MFQVLSDKRDDERQKAETAKEEHKTAIANKEAEH